MDQITITVAGQSITGYLCERCGAKVAPLSTFHAHTKRHEMSMSMLTETLVCVDCGGPINAVQSGQRRCQRCTGRARARHRARLMGKSGRPKLNRPIVNVNQGAPKRAVN